MWAPLAPVALALLPDVPGSPMSTRPSARGRVALCLSCGEQSRSDEDRCCVTCGRDLIVVDRASADVLNEARAEREELAKTAQVLLDGLIEAHVRRTDAARWRPPWETREELDLYFAWCDATISVMCGLESELERTIRALR